MTKKIVAIMGSPHVDGNTANAIQTIVENSLNESTICKKYNLCQLNIKNCIGCRKCVENGGVCVLQDDMKMVFEEIKTADALIIGCPIYINQVNGLTKTLLDRMFPLTDKNHKPRFGRKKLILVCTYGAPIPFIFNRYIRSTGKSLKAMGLITYKNIIIPGCSTNDKVKKDGNLQKKLSKFGSKFEKNLIRNIAVRR